MSCHYGEATCLDTSDSSHECPVRARAPRRVSPAPARCASCGWRTPAEGWTCSVCSAGEEADARARVRRGWGL